MGCWTPEIIFDLAKFLIKFEFRNPKSETILKSEFSNAQNDYLASYFLGFWSFEIRICFDIRASVFEFLRSIILFFLRPPVSSKKIWDTISLEKRVGGFLARIGLIQNAALDQVNPLWPFPKDEKGPAIAEEIQGLAKGHSQIMSE